MAKRSKSPTRSGDATARISKARLKANKKAAALPYSIISDGNGCGCGERVDVTAQALLDQYARENDVLVRKDRKRLADGKRSYRLVQNTDISTLEHWFIYAPA